MLIKRYKQACQRFSIMPIQAVEKQIMVFKFFFIPSFSFMIIFSTRVQFDTIDFEHTNMDDDAAVCLAEMLDFYDSAVKLNLSFNKQIKLRGWQALFKCVSLKLLNLRYTSFSEQAVPSLARALKTQPSLTILHLENVSLSGKNLLLLVCALKTNNVLRELYLGDNNLHPTDGAHLYQLILSNTSLQMLDLRNNQLQDGGLMHICDALKHKDVAQKSALSALVLWNNGITSNGMESMAIALKKNAKLKTLNIGSNKLSFEGILALKPALMVNLSLQRLGLQATNLCSAIVLAECIADNHMLVRVDLRDNARIGSAGLLALHLAMKMNTSITLLNLDYTCTNSNKIKYQDQFKHYFDEIKSFCDRNRQTALEKLSVQSSSINSEGSQVESPVMEDSGFPANEINEMKSVDTVVKVEGVNENLFNNEALKNIQSDCKLHCSSVNSTVLSNYVDVCF
ncbi:unnamed protein product [Dracunculus medinensis]|uniref:Leucine-rich repeat-containing protein 34 n=1 Tax=Dracunculus medinensis TaxID=318479 RepID=A0A0N4UCT4_DRAME|nr:unnamed protein product [Dracunculus medinensis]